MVIILFNTIIVTVATGIISIIRPFGNFKFLISGSHDGRHGVMQPAIARANDFDPVDSSMLDLACATRLLNSVRFSALARFCLSSLCEVAKGSTLAIDVSIEAIALVLWNILFRVCFLTTLQHLFGCHMAPGTSTSRQPPYARPAYHVLLCVTWYNPGSTI